MANKDYLLTDEQVEKLRQLIESKRTYWKVGFLTQFAGGVYYTICELDTPFAVVQYFGITKEKHYHNITRIEDLVSVDKLEDLVSAGNEFVEWLESEER